MIPQDMEARIGEAGIIAVLVIDDHKMAMPVARVLADNGIAALELTFRTESALDSLRAIVAEVPTMLTGVGTIIMPGQAWEAQNAGAAFGVSPGYNPDVVSAAQSIGFPFAPGISTPSEIEGAVNKGCRVLKFFHAEGLGGARYLTGVNSPYSFMDLKYIPLGGIGISNMHTYLELPEILAIGGSWIAPRKLIQVGDLSAIARNAQEAVKRLQEIRG